VGLKLYFKENDEFVAVSQTDQTSPLATVHDGKTGDVISTQVFVRNDDSDLWFSNIEVLPIDLGEGVAEEGDVSYEDTGWGVKLAVGTEEPTLSMWEDIDWGNTISFSSIGSSVVADTTTYNSFWYMISCPPNTDAQNKDNIVLRVEYTENAV
jgi:hypothetical protein